MSPPFFGVNGSKEKLIDAMFLVDYVFGGCLWSAHNPVAALFGIFECIQATGDNR